jgi:protoporphyrin/coproporphyrin ferrochelatase
MPMSDHAPGQDSRSEDIGILLVNLGTPDATDFWSVRRYLHEFLWDRRVIETPRLIWWLILNLIVLSIRPGRSAKAYAQIWNKERNESPLKTISRAQAEALEAWIAAGGLGASRPRVAWAMRYANPSIAAGLALLEKHGCTKLLVVPLYPQYAAATTATVGDVVFTRLMRLRFQPALRIAAPYYDAPVYIDALAQSLRSFVKGLNFTPQAILASFHGIPKAYADRGDPYPVHCEATYRLLQKALGDLGERLKMTYQSRFGAGEWLKPYTDATIESLAREQVDNLVVVAPGFAADCLETLAENGLENRHLFLASGGKNFAIAPCLNDSPEGMRVIQAIVARELAGWI